MTAQRNIPAMRLHAEAVHRPDGLVIQADGKDRLVTQVVLTMSRRTERSPWVRDGVKVSGKYGTERFGRGWSRDSGPIVGAEHDPKVAELLDRLERAIREEADR